MDKKVSHYDQVSAKSSLVYVVDLVASPAHESSRTTPVPSTSKLYDGNKYKIRKTTAMNRIDTTNGKGNTFSELDRNINLNLNTTSSSYSVIKVNKYSCKARYVTEKQRSSSVSDNRVLYDSENEGKDTNRTNRRYLHGHINRNVDNEKVKCREARESDSAMHTSENDNRKIKRRERGRPRSRNSVPDIVTSDDSDSEGERHSRKLRYNKLKRRKHRKNENSKSGNEKKKEKINKEFVEVSDTEGQETSSESDSTDNETGPHECSFCEKTFQKYNRLEMHYYVHFKSQVELNTFMNSEERPIEYPEFIPRSRSEHRKSVRFETVSSNNIQILDETGSNNINLDEEGSNSVQTPDEVNYKNIPISDKVGTSTENTQNLIFQGKEKKIQKGEYDEKELIHLCQTKEAKVVLTQLSRDVLSNFYFIDQTNTIDKILTANQLDLSINKLCDNDTNENVINKETHDGKMAIEINSNNKHQNIQYDVLEQKEHTSSVMTDLNTMKLRQRKSSGKKSVDSNTERTEEQAERKTESIIQANKIVQVVQPQQSCSNENNRKSRTTLPSPKYIPNYHNKRNMHGKFQKNELTDNSQLVVPRKRSSSVDTPCRNTLSEHNVTEDLIQWRNELEKDKRLKVCLKPISNQDSVDEMKDLDVKTDKRKSGKVLPKHTSKSLSKERKKSQVPPLRIKFRSSKHKKLSQTKGKLKKQDTKKKSSTTEIYEENTNASYDNKAKGNRKKKKPQMKEESNSKEQWQPLETDHETAAIKLIKDKFPDLKGKQKRPDKTHDGFDRENNLEEINNGRKGKVNTDELEKEYQPNQKKRKLRNHENVSNLDTTNNIVEGQVKSNDLTDKHKTVVDILTTKLTAAEKVKSNNIKDNLKTNVDKLSIKCSPKNMKTLTDLDYLKTPNTALRNLKFKSPKEQIHDNVSSIDNLTKTVSEPESIIPATDAATSGNSEILRILESKHTLDSGSSGLTRKEKYIGSNRKDVIYETTISKDSNNTISDSEMKSDANTNESAVENSTCNLSGAVQKGRNREKKRHVKSKHKAVKSNCDNHSSNSINESNDIYDFSKSDAVDESPTINGVEQTKGANQNNSVNKNSSSSSISSKTVRDNERMLSSKTKKGKSDTSLVSRDKDRSSNDRDACSKTNSSKDNQGKKSKTSSKKNKSKSKSKQMMTQTFDELDLSLSEDSGDEKRMKHEHYPLSREELETVDLGLNHHEDPGVPSNDTATFHESNCDIDSRSKSKKSKTRSKEKAKKSKACSGTDILPEAESHKHSVLIESDEIKASNNVCHQETKLNESENKNKDLKQISDTSTKESKDSDKLYATNLFDSFLGSGIDLSESDTDEDSTKNSLEVNKDNQFNYTANDKHRQSELAEKKSKSIDLSLPSVKRFEGTSKMKPSSENQGNEGQKDTKVNGIDSLSNAVNCVRNSKETNKQIHKNQSESSNIKNKVSNSNKKAVSKEISKERNEQHSKLKIKKDKHESKVSEHKNNKNKGDSKKLEHKSKEAKSDSKKLEPKTNKTKGIDKQHCSPVKKMIYDLFGDDIDIEEDEIDSTNSLNSPPITMNTVRDAGFDISDSGSEKSTEIESIETIPDKTEITSKPLIQCLLLANGSGSSKNNSVDKVETQSDKDSGFNTPKKYDCEDSPQFKEREKSPIFLNIDKLTWDQQSPILDKLRKDRKISNSHADKEHNKMRCFKHGIDEPDCLDVRKKSKLDAEPAYLRQSEEHDKTVINKYDNHKGFSVENLQKENKVKNKGNTSLSVKLFCDNEIELPESPISKNITDNFVASSPKALFIESKFQHSAFDKDVLVDQVNDPVDVKFKDNPEVFKALLYQCEICHRRYKSRSKLSTHWEESEHYNLTLQPLTKTLYKCSICKKQFFSHNTMLLHEAICSIEPGNGPSCKRCEVSFTDFTEKKNHEDRNACHLSTLPTVKNAYEDTEKLKPQSSDRKKSFKREDMKSQTVNSDLLELHKSDWKAVEQNVSPDENENVTTSNIDKIEESDSVSSADVDRFFTDVSSTDTEYSPRKCIVYKSEQNDKNTCILKISKCALDKNENTFENNKEINAKKEHAYVDGDKARKQETENKDTQHTDKGRTELNHELRTEIKREKKFKGKNKFDLALTKVTLSDFSTKGMNLNFRGSPEKPYWKITKTDESSDVKVSASDKSTVEACDIGLKRKIVDKSSRIEKEKLEQKTESLTAFEQALLPKSDTKKKQKSSKDKHKHKITRQISSDSDKSNSTVKSQVTTKTREPSSETVRKPQPFEISKTAQKIYNNDIRRKEKQSKFHDELPDFSKAPPTLASLPPFNESMNPKLREKPTVNNSIHNSSTNTGISNFVSPIKINSANQGSVKDLKKDIESLGIVKQSQLKFKDFMNPSAFEKPFGDSGLLKRAGENYPEDLPPAKFQRFASNKLSQYDRDALSRNLYNDDNSYSNGFYNNNGERMGWKTETQTSNYNISEPNTSNQSGPQSWGMFSETKNDNCNYSNNYTCQNSVGNGINTAQLGFINERLNFNPSNTNLETNTAANVIYPESKHDLINRDFQIATMPNDAGLQNSSVPSKTTVLPSFSNLVRTLKSPPSAFQCIEPVVETSASLGTASSYNGYQNYDERRVELNIPSVQNFISSTPIGPVRPKPLKSNTLIAQNLFQEYLNPNHKPINDERKFNCFNTGQEESLPIHVPAKTSNCIPKIAETSERMPMSLDERGEKNGAMEFLQNPSIDLPGGTTGTQIVTHVNPLSPDLCKTNNITESVGPKSPNPPAHDSENVDVLEVNNNDMEEMDVDEEGSIIDSLLNDSYDDVLMTECNNTANVIEDVLSLSDELNSNGSSANSELRLAFRNAADVSPSKAKVINTCVSPLKVKNKMTVVTSEVITSPVSDCEKTGELAMQQDPTLDDLNVEIDISLGEESDSSKVKDTTFVKAASLNNSFSTRNTELSDSGESDIKSRKHCLKNDNHDLCDKPNAHKTSINNTTDKNKQNLSINNVEDDDSIVDSVSLTTQESELNELTEKEVALERICSNDTDSNYSSSDEMSAKMTESEEESDLGINQSNTEDMNVNQSNVKDSNINQSNIKDSNIDQSNIKDSIIDQTNIKDSIIDQSESEDPDVLELYASDEDASFLDDDSQVDVKSPQSSMNVVESPPSPVNDGPELAAELSDMDLESQTSPSHQQADIRVSPDPVEPSPSPPPQQGKRRWVPPSFCYNHFDTRCRKPNCIYSHQEPTPDSLKRFFPVVMECVGNGQFQRAVYILQSHAVFQQMISKESVYMLYDKCLCSGLYEECYNIVLLMKDRNFIVHKVLDDFIHMCCVSNVPTPILGAYYRDVFMIAQNLNIPLKHQSSDILIRTFISQQDVEYVWGMIQYSTKMEGYCVPLGYIHTALTGIIHNPDYADMAVQWLKEADIQLLQNIDPKLLQNLCGVLTTISQGNNNHEYQHVVLTLQRMLSNPTHEQPRPLMDLPIVNQHQRTTNVSPMPGSSHSNSINNLSQPSTPSEQRSRPPTPRTPRSRSATPIWPGDHCNSSTEQQMSQESEDDVEFKMLVKNINSVRLTQDWKYLAELYLDRCMEQIPVSQSYIKHFIHVVAQDLRNIDTAFKSFLTQVYLKLPQKKKERSTTQLDSKGLSYIGNELLYICYNEGVWSSGYEILYQMKETGILFLNCPVHKDIMARATEMCLKVEECYFVLDLLNEMDASRLESDVKCELLVQLKYLLDQLSNRGGLQECYTVLLFTFNNIFNGPQMLDYSEDTFSLPSISNMLISKCLGKNMVQIAVNVYKLFLQFGKPFTIKVTIKRALVNAMFPNRMTELTRSMYEQLKTCPDIPTQSLDFPRSIIVRSYLTAAEVFFVISDYMECLYNLFCETVLATNSLNHGDLNLRIVIDTQTKSNKDFNIKGPGVSQEETTMLSVQACLTHHFKPALHTTCNRRDFSLVITPDSLEQYLYMYDQIRNQQGLVFTRQRPSSQLGRRIARRGRGFVTKANYHRQ